MGADRVVVVSDKVKPGAGNSRPAKDQSIHVFTIPTSAEGARPTASGDQADAVVSVISEPHTCTPPVGAKHARKRCVETGLRVRSRWS